METVRVTGEQLTRHPLPCGSDQLMLQTAFERAGLFEQIRLDDSPKQPSTPTAPQEARAQPPDAPAPEVSPTPEERSGHGSLQQEEVHHGEPVGLPPALAARVLLTVRSEGGAVCALLIRKGDASLGLTIGTDGLEGADLAHTA